MTNADKPAVKPANQRGAARLAAVQALYQMDVGGTGVLEIVAEYEAHRLGQELDGENYLKADASWFRSIVSVVVRDTQGRDITAACGQLWLRDLRGLPVAPNATKERRSGTPLLAA